MAPILRFFVVRPAEEVVLPSGEVEQRSELIVPLVPMDLIPEGIDIKGIPRQLTLSETMGMTHVGTSTLESDRNEAGLLLRQQTGGSTSTMATANASPLTLGSPRRVSEQRTGKDSCKQGQDLPQPGPPSGSSRMVMPLTPAKTPTLPQRISFEMKAKNSGSPTGGHRTGRSRSRSRSCSDSPEEPLHCQPWCHHGKCPRGEYCRSKHEMPATLEGLKKVGLEKLPYWYSQQAKGRRQWQGRAREAWTPPKHGGRHYVDNSPRPSQWHPMHREHPRNHEDRVRAENIRALEFMNRDIEAGHRKEKQEDHYRGPVRRRDAEQHQDLISMDYLESLPHPVMEDTDEQ